MIYHQVMLASDRLNVKKRRCFLMQVVKQWKPSMENIVDTRFCGGSREDWVTYGREIH